jgi:hypothetical protein
MKNTMMKKFFVGLFSLLMGVGSAFAQTNMSSEMYDLAKMKEGLRNRRVSSYDRTGNNRDHLKAIKPGETAVLADIKGAGVINHIWITMSPGPRQLSRNDIILRMYWDGSDEPSVVSPIGPFFGQGWNEQYNYASFALSSGPNGGTGLCSYFGDSRFFSFEVIPDSFRIISGISLFKYRFTFFHSQRVFDTVGVHRTAIQIH